MHLQCVGLVLNLDSVYRVRFTGGLDVAKVGLCPSDTNEGDERFVDLCWPSAVSLAMASAFVSGPSLNSTRRRTSSQSLRLSPGTSGRASMNSCCQSSSAMLGNLSRCRVSTVLGSADVTLLGHLGRRGRGREPGREPAGRGTT